MVIFHFFVRWFFFLQQGCNTYYKKISILLPLFYKICLITDFKEKAKVFNFFFSNQCSLMPNNKLMSTKLLTNAAIDIGKIIQNLDSNKGHGHEG